MSDIKYCKDRELDDRLAQSMFELVGESLRHANSRNNLYDEDTLEAFIGIFRPDVVKSWLPRDISSHFAFDGDRLIGTAFLGHRDDDAFPDDRTRAYLSGMYVNPDYQQGYRVGSGLLNSVVDSAKRNGIKTIRAYTTLFPKTMEFYKWNGFKEISANLKILKLFI